MPDGRSLMPRVRMPKVTLPGRASRRATRAKTTETKPKTDNKAANGDPAVKEGAKPEGGPSAQTPVANPATGAKAPDPNVQERIEGLQGWMAEIERKQARTTYFGAVALLIAIAAAGAALYFGISAKNDSATKGDADALEQRVDSLQSAVTKNSKDTQDTINNSIAQLQASIQALQKQQAQNAATISTLQSQVAAAAQAKGAKAAGTTVTPGAATTTTTPKKP
jgi:hypothetical protein